MNKQLFTFGLFALLLIGVPANAATEKALAERIAASGTVSKEEAKLQVERVIDSLKAEMQAGNSITIKNFGKFHVVTREARQARNPKTGQAVAVPTRRYPRFASSDSFKKSMNVASTETTELSKKVDN